MSVFNQIRNYVAKKATTSATAESLCPNCWGRQEYEGKFYEALHQEKVDLNNIDQKKGWIEAYAAKHLGGILLEKMEDESLVCGTCKVAYRSS